MRRNFFARLAGRLGAVLLFVTAGLHASGVGGAEVSEPFLAAAFVPVWLFASVHWLSLGVVAGACYCCRLGWRGGKLSLRFPNAYGVCSA